MRFGAFFFGLSVVACTLEPRPALAVGPRVFELDSLEKLSGGDLHGVIVGSDGVVRAGFTLTNLSLPADAGTTVTCALALSDGSVLVGTGPASGGKIVRIANDAATVFADTKENAVNALAMDRAGTIYAATTSGRIYRVTQGHADVFATLPDVDSVFALAVSKSGAIYAGTGSDGDVFRISSAGAPSVYFKADDPFVVSLALGEAPGGDEIVFAGTSGKGLIYRIAAPGRATVLYDPPGEDVHALAVGPNHVLYAVANEEPGGGSSTDSSEAAARRASASRAPAGPSPTSRAKPGKGALWRFDADGRPERMMHHDEFHYLSLAVDGRGAPYVGTGAEGRVYTVDDAHAVSLAADLDQRQVGAIGFAGRTEYIVGSDPATFHRVISIGGPDAVWTSKPLDAGLRARFGHLTWDGTGKLEVATRTGDTPTPDSTWSAWSAPVAYGGPVQSPGGRFVQVRARLGDAAAAIADVKLPFVTENLRAVVTDVEMHDRSGPHEPHETKEGLPASGGSPPKHDAVLHVTWKVDNPDNDELRYEVHFRREGQARWLNATSTDDVLTKPELDWDTSSLPEGKYRLRVDASDELANPPSDVTRHGLESAPVVVDNTPPYFKTLGIQGRRLRGEVMDGIGPVVRIEVAVDGQVQWRPIAPVDGIFDTADESFDADIAAFLPPGGAPHLPHLVAVRAFDAAGNAVVRDVEAP